MFAEARDWSRPVSTEDRPPRYCPSTAALACPAGAHPHAPAAFFTGGIVHVPSRIDGAVSSGQYMRSIRMNLPAGAGSQFDSLSAPGESFWIRRSTEPSGLDLRCCSGLIE